MTEAPTDSQLIARLVSCVLEVLGYTQMERPIPPVVAAQARELSRIASARVDLLRDIRHSLTLAYRDAPRAAKE